MGKVEASSSPSCWPATLPLFPPGANPDRTPKPCVYFTVTNPDQVPLRGAKRPRQRRPAHKTFATKWGAVPAQGPPSPGEQHSCSPRNKALLDEPGKSDDIKSNACLHDTQPLELKTCNQTYCFQWRIWIFRDCIFPPPPRVHMAARLPKHGH